VLSRPAFLPSCDPIPRDSLPRGERWRFEVKFDGYRVQIHKAGRDVAVYSRNGHDWTRRFPHLVDAIRALPGSAIIEGELVATAPDGLATFRQLHATVSGWREEGLVVFAFDILADQGEDIRALTLH
jgi:bifunctional non-homologous end joining protein LigD